MNADQFEKLLGTFLLGLNEIIKSIPATQPQSMDILSIVSDAAKKAALLNDLQEEDKKMLKPQRSVTVPLHFFMNTYQTDQKNVATLQKNLDEWNFVVECECKLSVYCADLFLRTKFCRGIWDEKLQGQLLQESFVDFQKMVQKAMSIEANRKDAKMQAQKEVAAQSPTLRSEAQPTNIHRLSQRTNHWRSQQPKQKPNVNNDKTRNKYRSRFRELGIDDLCLHCGRANHVSQDCRVSREKLNFQSCGKCVNLPKICIASLIRAKNQRNHESKSQH